ncbi:MAG: methionine synthase [Alphaproteobacteria bacterium]|nr:methionine synthase [Alphaproteobacteria bacterium]
MTKLMDYLDDRVLLADGAMGTRVQALNLSVEKDFLGQENCTDILTKSRPDLVRDIHMGYFGAGADAVETNTFGASPVTLGEFGLSEEALDLNKRSAELAREAAEEFTSDDCPRFVLGSIGPGTKLPSLGHIDYQTLEDSFAMQCAGLAAGGVDAFLIETCQDTLQIKAAVNGAKRARMEAKTDIPIITQVTVETAGTLLVGADIAAAATVVEALDISVIGLNCATGPQEMSEHVKWLAENWPGFISVLPNAGLPELVDGQPHYPLSPEELAHWHERFLDEDGVNIIGGCCGTDIPHIEALDAMLRERAASTKGGNKARPKPAKRRSYWVPSVASLYGQVSYRQENAFLDIGERCNANGSKKFRDLQEARDWDACVEIGREQVPDGAHALDICTAFVGRDEEADMVEVVSRMRGAVTVPLVFDSTEQNVLEAALRLYGGKPIINSINFEDGEDPANERMKLVRHFGTGLIALTIDEEGMAKTTEKKVTVAHRLHDFACTRHGLPPSDLLIDPLTFTICTGNEDDRKLALMTLNAIEQIAKELPECQIILGLSNVSFGINPAARHVLNSVFLDHALKRGVTGAILHSSRIMPLHKIQPEEVKAAEDLIFDRRAKDHDPLQNFLAMFEGRALEKQEKKKPPANVEERLKLRIIDGDRQGIEADLEEALGGMSALDIINTVLLDGMKVVGDLFGSGQMQLPFVLQSAATMKTAVACLEPHMEHVEGREKGVIVLATVKGDVHDIGKNLVDIILTNNGYKVINLGIKQPIEHIMAAAQKHKADVIGMSGLLVKSTVVMRENLEKMTREGFDLPVVLGGAALNRKYVERDCVAAYGSGSVAYARNAFDGLNFMDKVAAREFDAHLASNVKKRGVKSTKTEQTEGSKAPLVAKLRPTDYEAAKLQRNELTKDVTILEPPFWGAKIIDLVPIKNLLVFLNEAMLYQFHWGYKKQGRTREEFRKWARGELKPILTRIAKQCHDEKIITSRAVYGYWKCAGDGNDVILFEKDGMSECARFTMPRQRGKNGLCIADFFRDIDGEKRDLIALQAVTVGPRVSEVALEWFHADKYQDYLYLHGFGVEMTEALAEYVHKRIRTELGFAAEDARDVEKLIKQGYHGARYSFGYPAFPNLADQEKLIGLLDAERIGLTMSESDQLHPEQSTTAIVVHHPQARYFTV